MPTALDRLMHSKNAFAAFTGLVVAASAWAIMSDTPIFPKHDEDPSGEPETWTLDELVDWLKRRSLQPDSNATNEELLERVKLNMRQARP